MQIRGVSHINMRLSQPVLDNVVDFYTNVLGFTVGERPPFKSRGVWLYAGGRPIIHLVLAGMEETAIRQRAGIVDHIALSCTNYDASLAELDAAGVRYREQQVPERPIRQLFFDDPAGLGVELIFDED